MAVLIAEGVIREVSLRRVEAAEFSQVLEDAEPVLQCSLADGVHDSIHRIKVPAPEAPEDGESATEERWRYFFTRVKTAAGVVAISQTIGLNEGDDAIWQRVIGEESLGRVVNASAGDIAFASRRADTMLIAAGMLPLTEE